MTVRISCQLYSARNHGSLEEQLGLLAALGYSNVEPYGALFDDAGGLADALARHNLAAPSCHVGLDVLRGDAEAVVTKARTIGAELLIVPFIAPDDRPPDSAGWRALGRRLAVLQAVYSAHDLRLAWHNHDFEFSPTPEGDMPMALILDAVPALAWQADIGWLERTGVKSVDWLKEYGDRVVALHLKDLAPTGDNANEDGWADAGHGIIDWPYLLPMMRATRAELVVLEHDNPADFERFARRSLANVSGWFR